MRLTTLRGRSQRGTAGRSTGCARSCGERPPFVNKTQTSYGKALPRPLRALLRNCGHRGRRTVQRQWKPGAAKPHCYEVIGTSAGVRQLRTPRGRPVHFDGDGSQPGGATTCRWSRRSPASPRRRDGPPAASSRSLPATTATPHHRHQRRVGHQLAGPRVARPLVDHPLRPVARIYDTPPRYGPLPSARRCWPTRRRAPQPTTRHWRSPARSPLAQPTTRRSAASTVAGIGAGEHARRARGTTRACRGPRRRSSATSPNFTPAPLRNRS